MRISFDGKNIESSDFKTVLEQIANKRFFLPERPPASVRASGLFENLSGPAFRRAVVAELEAAAQGSTDQVEGAIIMVQIGCATAIQLLAALALSPIGTLARSQHDPAMLILQHLDGTHRVAVFTQKSRAAKAMER